MDENTLAVTNENVEDLAAKVDSLVNALQQQLEQKQIEDEKVVEEQLQQDEILTEINTSINDLTLLLAEEKNTVLAESSSTNEQLVLVIAELEELNDFLEMNMPIIEASSSTIVGYGVFYAPLIIIVLGLWWFFKQFLTDFR